MARAGLSLATVGDPKIMGQRARAREKEIAYVSLSENLIFTQRNIWKHIRRKRFLLSGANLRIKSANQIFRIEIKLSLLHTSLVWPLSRKVRGYKI